MWKNSYQNQVMMFRRKQILYINEKLKTKKDDTDEMFFSSSLPQQLSCATTPAMLIQPTKPHVEHSFHY